MRFSKTILLLVFLSSFCGCRIFRGIEQWKCDRLGLCHFGTTPSTLMRTPPAYSIPPQTSLPFVAPSMPMQPSCPTCQPLGARVNGN